MLQNLLRQYFIHSYFIINQLTLSESKIQTYSLASIMGSQKDEVSVIGDNSENGDAEDNIPSDFFDDFNKDDFMNGLSVIDSWDDDDKGRPRIDTETLDRVNDLRELIGDSRGEEVNKYKKRLQRLPTFDLSKYRWRKEDKSQSRPSESDSHLDDYIKPGSRRDPSKTNEAIKKDKEVKVKEYLAKHLEASDDLRPPGTELDDYYVEKQGLPKKSDVSEESKLTHRPREHQRRDSPVRSRRSPRRSPRKHRSRSPRKLRSRSPYRPHRTPIDGRRISPRRFSPRRLSPRRMSPRRFKRQWSPRRLSPARSPRRSHRSRSPRRRHSPRRSRTPESHLRQDNFLYPHSDPSMMYPPAGNPYVPGVTVYPGDYPGGIPGYSYPQGPPYAGYGGPGYEYGMQPAAAPAIPLPQPVPAPVLDPAVAPAVAAPLTPVQAPISLAAPEMVPPPSQVMPPDMKSAKPYDALAQLVAEGKLSQEDYLKLAPNKGMSNTSMDTKTRVMVLNRCSQAFSKLSHLLLPNRLTMNSAVIGQEPKYLAPKFCSPLKRQATVEFQFTKNGGASAYHNKQLVDSIISTIGLDKVVARPKKKIPKDTKDAAVQTTRPHCDVCEIRESAKFNEAGTSTDPEYFSSSIHTQVVEQDLINSKSIFNPTGGASSSAPISIAHLTPAQLVSQLAARAKTLKETEPNQFSRRNPPNNYDNYDNRGGQYNNNYTYRY